MMTISSIPSHPINVPASPVRAARASTSATAPAADDNALLAALSDEEREFFQSSQAIGPVSYGRRGVTPARVDAPIGQLLDRRA